MRLETPSRPWRRRWKAVYQYDPEAYRQLHDEKVAQLRRDYQGPQGRPRVSAERFLQSVRSVQHLRPHWRSQRRAPIYRA